MIVHHFISVIIWRHFSVQLFTKYFCAKNSRNDKNRFLRTLRKRSLCYVLVSNLNDVFVSTFIQFNCINIQIMDNLCEITDEQLDDNSIEKEVKKSDSIYVKKSSLDELEINELSKYETMSSSRSPSNEVPNPLMTTCSSLATSPLESPSTSKSLSPQQAIRSDLRRDFLRLLSSLHKRRVCLKLYECPLPLSANFEGCDAQFNHLFLTSFETPIGLQKSSIVRTNDVIELEFNFDNNQLNQDNTN